MERWVGCHGDRESLEESGGKAFLRDSGGSGNALHPELLEAGVFWNVGSSFVSTFDDSV